MGNVFLKWTAKGITITLGEFLGSSMAQAFIGVVEGYNQYYWSDPNGEESGCGYFIDHPEDTEKETNLRTFTKRVAIDHHWDGLAKLCSKKEKKGKK
jgi:hypothetical protein